MGRARAAWVAGGALLIKEGFYQYARRQAVRLGSRLLMANATDHRADAVASLLALVAVIVANVNPEWKALDKVVGLVLAGWLGAEGINMGTRFIATKEAPVHENVKQAIVAASELDTRLVMRPLRNTERVLTNAAVERLLEKERRLGPDIKFEDIIEEVDRKSVV